MNLIQTADYWWSWMAPMLWQGTVIMVLVAVTDRLLARWVWPQVRLTLWLLVLLKLVLPPTTASPVAIPQIREIAAVPVDMTQSGTMTLWLFALWATVSATLGTLATFRIRRAHRRLNEDTRRVPGWVRSLAREQAGRLGLERIPTIRISPGMESPAVTGVLRPCILLPESMLSGPRTDVELAILHELAHIKRGDLVVNLLVLVLQIVYWFHPLVWWMRRRIGALNELCCDATVASLLDGTGEYRATLLRGARRLLSDRGTTLGLTGGGNIIQRLDWLQRDTWKRAPMRRLFNATIAVAMVAFVLPMAATDEAQSSAHSASVHRVAPEAIEDLRSAAHATLERAAQGEQTGCITLRYSAALLLARQERE